MKHFSSCPASYIHEIKEQDQCQHEITATLVFWGRAEAVEHSDHTVGRLKKKNYKFSHLKDWCVQKTARAEGPWKHKTA